MTQREFEKAVLWIIKIGLWVIPVLPLYISTGMLFPFITGKNFFFRIIVEVIFALWVGLAIAHPRFRPRLTLLVKAATIFIVILFLADLFSPNPYRSFFSNYERMEGFMMLFHLYLYFLMLISVFKTRRDWLIFFHVTLATSLIVSFIGLLQKLGLRVSLQGGFRVDSTIGNPTYLAAYLLFHVWLLVLLIREFWRKWWLTIFYGASLVFEIVILYFTATRGATLAFVAVSVLLLVAVVIFWRRVFPFPVKPGILAGYGRGRAILIAVLALLIAVPLIFWSLRNTAFIQNTQVLKRLTNYSLEERTIQSRFMIWKMSARAAKDRPILGWGQENYYLVFQRYFNPGLYAQEPWFDRSHNSIFDWLINAGLLGLLSYLSIAGVTFLTLLRASRAATFPLFQGLVLGSIFLTHFLQNLFVFDNLNTYILFFAFLAYTQYLAPTSTGAEIMPQPKLNSRNQDAPRSHSTLALGVGAGLLVFIILAGYALQVKPMQESRRLIQALILNQGQAKPEDILTAFKTALSYHTFGDTEVREQLANVARGVPGNNRYTPEEQKKFVEFAVDEMRKEISHPAKDIKHMLFLAAILSRAQGLNPQYGPEAESVLRDAVRISPTKQILYFELAQHYLIQQRFDDATTVLRQALALEPRYQQAAINLLIAGALAKNSEVVKEAGTYIDLSSLDEDTLQRVGTAYRSVNDLVLVRPVYEELVRRFPRNAQSHAILAALLGEFGEIERAIEEAKRAAELDANFAKEAEAFIKVIEERMKNTK